MRTFILISLPAGQLNRIQEQVPSEPRTVSIIALISRGRFLMMESRAVGVVDVLRRTELFGLNQQFNR